MRARFGQLDIVSYNTLLKGFTSSGGLTAAFRLLCEMEQAGVEPNATSFNSIINSAVCRGDLREALCAIDTMKKRGSEPDNSRSPSCSSP